MTKDGRPWRSVELTSDGLKHTLSVDGTDLSRGARAVSLELEAGSFPKVVIEPAIIEVQSVRLAKAEVILGPHVTDLLVVLGWTPPEAGPQPDPGNPWGIKYHRPGTAKHNPNLCTCGLPRSAAIHHEPAHAHVGGAFVPEVCARCHHVAGSDCHQGPTTESDQTPGG